MPASLTQRCAASIGNGVQMIDAALQASRHRLASPAAVVRASARRRPTGSRGKSVEATSRRPAPIGRSVKIARRDTTALKGTAKARTMRTRRLSSKAASAAGSSMGIEVGAGMGGTRKMPDHLASAASAKARLWRPGGTCRRPDGEGPLRQYVRYPGNYRETTP